MRANIVRKIFGRKKVPAEEPKKVYPVVEDFLMLATKYFYSIGVVPYESDEKPNFVLHLYLGFHVANLLFVWFTMMVFVVNSVRDNEDFLKISMVVGYITFGNVGVLKILVVQLQKRKLTSLVQNLKSLFPQPNKGTHEVIMQVIMHFDRLAKALREFDKWCSNGAEEDLNELRTLIVYHNQVLRLTSKMNDIFGVPLLLNLLNSSMLICNVGFQLTIGISLEYIGQQVLNILAALMEVYLICSLSQMLINAVR
ncbi:odorant receptor 67a isoform X3 [Drosophila sechellia]|uniref:odorant receptor 67a isoform X3 n=1 Tax=Drosophila sechellia TaxID=7238 RepID=UPI0013DDBE09|nr:odorant receptor 67a isoform X3 [Drosophila sechellia]